jgi:hypothetical protein
MLQRSDLHDLILRSLWLFFEVPLYNRFVALLRASGLRVETGQFGAMMAVEIANDGPVTLILEREPTSPSP